MNEDGTPTILCRCGSPATGGEAHFPDLAGIDYSTFPPIAMVTVQVFYLCPPCLEFASDLTEQFGELVETYE